MKNSIALLSIALSIAASASSAAFADGGAAASPEKILQITGPVAADLVHALEDAGAVSTDLPDASFVTVSRLSCAHGYRSRPQFTPFSSCTFEQLASVGPMTPAFRHESFKVEGEKAEALISAMASAGVDANRYPEMVGYRVIDVRCTSSFFPPMHSGRHCSLTLAQ